MSTHDRCDKCNKLLIHPMGNGLSPYLLVGETPGYHETIQGLPFAFQQKHSRTSIAGDILKAELLRVGIVLSTVLVTNLWRHQKSYVTETIGKKSRQVEACPLSYHLDHLARMFIDKTHVLLMGSAVTQALLDVKYTQVSGLNVKVSGFSKVRFWVSPNPALAFSQPVGELRLAFQRFSEDISKKKK